MTYIDLKRILLKQDIKQFEQFINVFKSINVKEMVPLSIHDTEIDKIRKSKEDYNFVDLSAYYGCEKMFKYFLTIVPQVILKQSSHITPLIFYALKGKNDNIINSVIQIGKFDQDIFNLYDALYFSLKLGDIKYLNIFFDEVIKQRPDDDQETVFYEIFNSQNHKPCSPLKLAIKSRNIMCVAFVLNISQMEIPLLNNTKLGKKKSKITPLHVAARYGCGDIAYLFITLNPKMITKKGTGNYLYSFLDAVKYNLVPLYYDEFFKHGPIKIINTPDSNGNNALHYAVKNGNFNIVQILLHQKNIDINAKGEEGKAPIHLAANVCNFDILTELLHNPQTNLLAKDDYNNLALHAAAEANWGKGFLEILSYTAKIIKDQLHNQNQTSPQLEYSQSKTFENNESHQYLQSDAPNRQINISTSPNIYPLNSNDTSSNANIFFSNPIAGQDISQIAKFKSCTQINNFKNTLRQSSASKTYIDTKDTFSLSDVVPFCSKYIKEDNNEDVDYKAVELSINCMNKMGLNCIHIAAIKNCFQIFKAMETAYPSINEKIYTIPSGLTGYTVLHYLAMCGHDKLLEYILERHSNICEFIDIHSKDPIVSPLYIASIYNQDKCVKILKLHGARKENLAKRPRNIGTYVHYPFMQALLEGNNDFLNNIKLDIEQVPSALKTSNNVESQIEENDV